MNYFDFELQALSDKVRSYLSENRYRHTLGVARAAAKLSEYCLPERKSALCAAALLHDVAKEYSHEDLISFIKKDGSHISEDELLSKPVLHSYASSYVIKRDFSDFAEEDILNACKNHTVGAPDMSVFEEIIFISDFIEDGRVYDSCRSVREALYSSLRLGDFENNLKSLHRAVISSIDFTVENLKKEKKHINNKILLTRNAFLSKI